MNPAPDLLARVAPPLFVVIWATGFIVARLVAPHADPLTFLSARYAIAIAVLGAVALVARAPWPCSAKGWRDGLVAGILLHGFYLGGVFLAVKQGLPAGIAALIAGLQPLLTGLLVGPLLGERVTPRQWAGIATGFAGAALVIAPRLGDSQAFSPAALLACLGAMVSMTLGTIWQKRTGAKVDLRTNTVVQYLGALAATLPLALLTESGRLDPVPALFLGLVWAVFGLSIGAVGLLLALLRRGAVASVAALLYLVPPVAALMAFVLFGEALSAVQVAGMALAALGVALAARP